MSVDIAEKGYPVCLSSISSVYFTGLPYFPCVHELWRFRRQLSSKFDLISTSNTNASLDRLLLNRIQKNRGFFLKSPVFECDGNVYWVSLSMVGHPAYYHALRVGHIQGRCETLNLV